MLSMSTVAPMLESTAAEDTNSLKENNDKWLHEHSARSSRKVERQQPSVLQVQLANRYIHSQVRVVFRAISLKTIVTLFSRFCSGTSDHTMSSTQRNSMLKIYPISVSFLYFTESTSYENTFHYPMLSLKATSLSPLNITPEPDSVSSSA